MDKPKMKEPKGPGKNKFPYPNSYWKAGHWYDLTTYAHLCHPDKKPADFEQKYKLLKARLGDLDAEEIFKQVQPIWKKKPTEDEKKIIFGFMLLVMDVIVNKIKRTIKEVENSK